MHPHQEVVEYGRRRGEVGFEVAMIDDRRKKMRERFTELRNAAIAELERRGYDVRGKTPAQIRQLLRRRPSKQKSDAPKQPNGKQSPILKRDRLADYG